MKCSCGKSMNLVLGHCEYGGYDHWCPNCKKTEYDLVIDKLRPEDIRVDVFTRRNYVAMKLVHMPTGHNVFGEVDYGKNPEFGGRYKLEQRLKRELIYMITKVKLLDSN